MIGRVFLLTVATCGISLASRAEQPDDGANPVALVAPDEYLSAGADAIRAGQYDDAIRWTLTGIERATSVRNRAAGFANLCAAYVAKGEPNQALPHCTESLALNDGNWRAFSNRSQAYFMKGMYAEAVKDNEAAAALAPNAAHVRMIRGLLNERLLRPSITIEEHQ